jgi:hypothetical protein
MRLMAKKYSNTFSVGIFACCREIYRPSKHCGLFGGTKEEADAHFRQILTIEYEAELAKDVKKQEEAQRKKNELEAQKLKQIQAVEEAKLKLKFALNFRRFWQDDNALRALLNGTLEEFEKKPDARGQVDLEAQKNKNFILVFGCKSGTGINAQSAMAEDFSTALISSYDETDMTCYLSTVLDALQGTDVNFEMVKSQTVRPLKLFYSHNKASILRAFIFTQSKVKEKNFVV